jgi:hypothetical protein
MNPELTVQKNAEVDLCWGMGGEKYFAALHRLADGTWDAWLTPSHVYSREEPTRAADPSGRQLRDGARRHLPHHG